MKKRLVLRRLLCGTLAVALLCLGMICQADVFDVVSESDESPTVELEWLGDGEGLGETPSQDAAGILDVEIEGNALADIEDLELDLDLNLTLDDEIEALDIDSWTGETDLMVDGGGAPVSAGKEESYCPGAGMSNDRAISGYIERAMYPSAGQSGSLRSNGNVGTRLQGVTGKLYTLLRQKVEKVAAGELDNTEFLLSIRDIYEDVAYSAADLGVDTLTDANGEVTLPAVFAFWIETQADVSKVIDALLADCPYDLYWYDKTSPTSWNNVTCRLDGDRLRIMDYATGVIRLRFPVAAEYSVSGGVGTYAVDTQKGQSVQAAAENAKKIIEANRSCGDLQKLIAYKDAICDLVTYNRAASSGEIANYGNPWQLVWVFDGDPDTNVVCEGYSKAFQYLCELSTFSGDVSAISVTGVMGSDRGGAGLHMWNLVTIGGVRYIADITNCDAGSVGAPDKLFMRGYSHLQDEYWGKAYYFDVGDCTIYYTFDSDIEHLFSAEELDICGDPVGPDTEGQTSGTAGSLVWKLDKDGVLYISGSGAMPDYSAQDPAPWAGDKAKRAYLSKGVTVIGAMAFYNCPNITMITVCVGIERVGENAFNVDKLRGRSVKGIVIPRCTEKTMIDYVEKAMINHVVVTHGNLQYEHVLEGTCVSAGRERAVCKGCGEVFEWNTPKNPNNHASIVTDAAVAATCTQDGMTAGSHCEACHTVIEAQRSVAAKGHKPVVDPAVPPTVDSEGLTEGSHCSVCGTVLVAQKTVPRLAKPTEAPTVKQTVKPTAKPTVKPTETPTVKPTAKPTAKPTEAPTVKPTESPTVKPTVKPSEAPTVKPTEAPTAKPTEAPTAKPTVKPTAEPTAKPTATPTIKPTETPTVKPTEAPTAEPTETPVPRISLAKARIAVKSQVYTGKSIEPPITVKLDGQTLKEGSDYSVSYANNKKIGVASVTVMGMGRYDGIAKIAFRINPRAVSGLTLESGEGQFTARWNKVAGVTGYQLQYGLKKNLKRSTKIKIARAATVSKELKRLKSGKVYYVRIRAYKTVKGKNYWSAWSAVKRIKTQ